jgi:ornithine cyclodeaminase/alanine dehydrogenase-like protein (mu-crystallin family)
MIGTGRPAWTQLWAISAVRQLSEVRIYSRDPKRRAAFAGRAAEELQVPARPAASSEQAAAGADIVVLATTSAEPVIDPAAIAAGTHLTTVGPKSAGAHETPAELLARAAIVTRDLPQQAGAYGEPFSPTRAGSRRSAPSSPRKSPTGPAQLTSPCTAPRAGRHPGPPGRGPLQLIPSSGTSSESLACLLVGVEHLLGRHVEESCNLKRER